MKTRKKLKMTPADKIAATLIGDLQLDLSKQQSMAEERSRNMSSHVIALKDRVKSLEAQMCILEGRILKFEQDAKKTLSSPPGPNLPPSVTNYPPIRWDWIEPPWRQPYRVYCQPSTVNETIGVGLIR